MRAACTRALTHHRRQTPHQTLTLLAESTPPDLEADRYGEGELLTAFEARIAAELGTEAAAFMPSGTMAQQIALRIWCDRSARDTIAFHPTCHLEIHESRAYAMLHGLQAIPLGSPERLMTCADLRAAPDPLGALLVELPQREIGAQLPSWDDLLALCAAARARGARVHLDGARLWEAAPFYGRSHAQIAALFDSAYVSFYKGLGAIAGAALAGDAEFVAQARVWQHRHGGRLVSLFPLALSARAGFERYLPHMGRFHERAVQIAERLDALRGVDVVPRPPHANSFLAFLHGTRERLEERARAMAREHGVWIFHRLAPTLAPDVQRWEFVVGDATFDFEPDEIAAIVRELVA